MKISNDSKNIYVSYQFEEGHVRHVRLSHRFLRFVLILIIGTVSWGSAATWFAVNEKQSQPIIVKETAKPAMEPIHGEAVPASTATLNPPGVVDSAPSKLQSPAAIDHRFRKEKLSLRGSTLTLSFQHQNLRSDQRDVGHYWVVVEMKDGMRYPWPKGLLLNSKGLPLPGELGKPYKIRHFANRTLTVDLHRPFEAADLSAVVIGVGDGSAGLKPVNINQGLVPKSTARIPPKSQVKRGS